MLLACSPIKLPVSNEYQLSAYSNKSLNKKPSAFSILVTAPDATAAYQTNEMLYIKTPFRLQSFAKNSWVSPPADMLYPLLVQSLQLSGYFYAVSSSPYTEGADYRLDSQVLALEQNFLTKPSHLEFSVKIVLTDINKNKVIASRLITLRQPCSADSPYGGVIAANQATIQLTQEVSRFVVSTIKQRIVK